MIACRACNGERCSVVVDLGHHPLADRFLTESMLELPETTYPLHVYWCADCGYAGLVHASSATERYVDQPYSYTASNSATSDGHFVDLAQEIANKSLSRHGPSAVVVDIGGNDGTLLKHIKGFRECSVLNIDASPNMCKLSEARGVPAWQGLFDFGIADQVARKLNYAEVVVCTNVLNHASDPLAFLRAAIMMLHPDGEIWIEVPSLTELIRRGAWDTIYAEHVSYFDAYMLCSMLEEAGAGAIQCETIDYMSGSLRVRAGKNLPFVYHVRAPLEDIRPSLADVQRIQVQANADRLVINAMIHQARESDGFRGIAAIGAAAKGNTILNFCKLDWRSIRCVADASPHKIGKFTPGSHIPIVDDQYVADGCFDEPSEGFSHGIVLPRNISGPLRDKFKKRDLSWIDWRL